MMMNGAVVQLKGRDSRMMDIQRPQVYRIHRRTQIKENRSLRNLSMSAKTSENPTQLSAQLPDTIV